MRELALHILDIVENSINAGATMIRIEMEEIRRGHELRIVVQDNGRGLKKDEINRALDPFYTTRTTRRVGLGLSLFKETCNRCGGKLEISSSPGQGTRVEAMIRLDHIDVPPLGDMASTLVSLIAGNPGVDFVYRHKVGSEEFELNTAELKRELGDDTLRNAEILRHIGEKIREGLRVIGVCNSWSFLHRVPDLKGQQKRP